MPVQLVAPPPAVSHTYQQSLLDLFGWREPEAKLYHLPVGTLDLSALAGGATLRDVQSTGCRFFASWADGTLISCEMTEPSLYGNAEFRNFVRGDAVAVAFTRIAEAQGLSAVQNGDFELRFLSIPGIYLEALHIVCLGDGVDLVLPLVSGYEQFPIDVVLESETFLAQARAIAATRLAHGASSNLSS